MSDLVIFDPMFRIPFFTGLTLTLALAIVGCFLRMRNEWLAALGLSQIAAAGGIAGALIHAPVIVSAFVVAALAMVIRSLLPRVGNSHHALFIIIGWSGTLLIGSYVDHGQRIGESLLRGQLYFATRWHLAGAVCMLIFVLATFKWLSPLLLTARFFPDHHRANRVVVWPYRFVFALITVTAAVFGTISIGAFPTFAALFVPPWVGFVMVDGWLKSIGATVGLATGAYIAAFVLAMLLDLPFGPVFTAVLILTGLLRWTTSMRRRNTESTSDDIQINYLSPADIESK